jgi:hypothetical protein
MSYSGGRYVVTNIEGDKFTVEAWEDPNDVLTVKQVSGSLPQVGDQLLRKVHRLRSTGQTYSSFEKPKRQLKERFIPVSSTSNDKE